ncbi:MAG: hypothetical protein GY751_18220, partial [Bacteroidetes bacterium]|nr:hypothetical protein [Bacteroidota bacterium]
MRVYFKSFDVNDPTGLIHDNHGGWLIGPPNGKFNNKSPYTDGDNTVETDFTVTMQPGDNFKVFASTGKDLIDKLKEHYVRGSTDDQGETVDSLKSLASDRLTIWRKVHIELDSMGKVTGNIISGNITNVTEKES